MISFKNLRGFWGKERKPEVQREYAKYEAVNYPSLTEGVCR